MWVHALHIDFDSTYDTAAFSFRRVLRFLFLRGRLLWGQKPENRTGFPLDGVETHTADGRYLFGMPQQEKAPLSTRNTYHRGRSLASQGTR